MKHQQGDERARETAEARHHGEGQGDADDAQTEPEGHLGKTPKQAEKQREQQRPRRYPGINERESRHQRQGQRPGHNQNSHGRKYQPEILPLPTAGGLHGE